MQIYISTNHFQGPATKGVQAFYSKVINRFGSECNFYHHTPLQEINRLSPILDEAVPRIRQNKVVCQAGYDGDLGVFHLFAKGKLNEFAGQGSLFNGIKRKKKRRMNSSPYSSP